MLKVWAPLALILVLLMLWTLRPLGGSPRHMPADAFDAARTIERLTAILGDAQPHPTGAAANDAVRARLLDQIEALGFTVEVRERFFCNTMRTGAAICAQPINVAFWVTPPGDNAVMLTAHYDSVPAGPGAADDGMGVAVALEVAHRLKGKQFARPVLVLLTDAEEAGLVGAAAFAAHDPLAARIGAVVNLEARGTTGGVNMFQTSTPNGRDVAALQAGRLFSSANALATNIYDILPNDTDLTMLLPLKVDAANFAIVGGGVRYHTSLDDLAHLDPRSVRQMGASALAAVTGFANADEKTRGEGDVIFVDFAQRVLFVLPEAGALLCVALGAIAALSIFWRSGETRRVRLALTPLLALAAGLGFAVLVGGLLVRLRPETAFASAWPIAPRIAYAAAALLGLSIVLRTLRIEGGPALATAAWLWFAALVLAVYAWAPGLSALAAWPLLFAIAAALAAFSPRLKTMSTWLLAAAGATFAFAALPLAGGLEDALFAEHAAPATLLLVFMILVLLPSGDKGLRFAPRILGGVLLAALAAALLLPAYDAHAPRHLSVVHTDKDGEGAFLIADNGPLPEQMKAAAAFAAKPDSDGFWRAPAPRLADKGDARVTSALAPDGSRNVTITINAPDADRQELLVSHGEGIQHAAINGVGQSIQGPLDYIGCSGRFCRQLQVTFSVNANAPIPAIKWRRTYFGAGPAAAHLIASRPDVATPYQDGDRRLIVRTIKLPSSRPQSGE